MDEYVSCDQCGDIERMNGGYCCECEKELCDYCMEDGACPDCKES